MTTKNIGKKKSIKCWEIMEFEKKYDYGCGYSVSGAHYYDYSMNRVYVKDKKTMVPIGYYCKKCGKIISDIEFKKFKKNLKK